MKLAAKGAESAYDLTNIQMRVKESDWMASIFIEYFSWKFVVFFKINGFIRITCNFSIFLNSTPWIVSPFSSKWNWKRKKSEINFEEKCKQKSNWSVCVPIYINGGFAENWSLWRRANLVQCRYTRFKNKCTNRISMYNNVQRIRSQSYAQIYGVCTNSWVSTTNPQRGMRCMACTSTYLP